MMRRLTITLLFLAFSCVWLEAQQLDTNQIYFQSYTSSAEQLRGWLSVTCPTTYSIALNKGLYGPSVTDRKMKNTNNTLNYQLFSDASYTSNWGDISGAKVTGTAASNTTVNIYAQIPALQTFSASSNYDKYSDTITATLVCNSTTITKTFSIYVQQVDPGCGIFASDLNFGIYTGTEVDANTTIQIGCSTNTHYSVGLSAGTGYQASVTNRSMTLTGGTAQLSYALYSNAGHSTNWGYTIGTDTVAGAGNNAVQNITVYGRIPARQSVATGNYTDTIIATLTY
jgi:spore coat protein U-like protein